MSRMFKEVAIKLEEGTYGGLASFRGFESRSLRHLLGMKDLEANLAG